MKHHDCNLGATMIKPTQGDLQVRCSDDICVDLTPDLIKIDLEGMKMVVLRGPSATIARVRPVIRIEVDETNVPQFADWCWDAGYVTLHRVSHGPHYVNHLFHFEKALT